MRRSLAFVFSFLVISLFCLAAPRTLRVDYYHGGNSKDEWFTLDRTVLEPLEWPGNLNKSIDASGLGNYLFEVREQASGKLVYSRGFSSVFAEWKTTDEAQHANRSFSESLRFPTPATPVDVSVKERDEKDPGAGFHEVWKTTVDPKDKFIDRSQAASPGPVLPLQKMGDPAGKVDLLVLGDGYTASERGKFESDAKRFMEKLFATSPFKEHKSDFNVWGICPPAAESGISRPSTGIYRRSPLGASYDTFDSERYILTTDNRAMRDVASFAPYEFVEILVNGKTYGGGGIFNQYATVAIDNAWAGYVGVHEFGHHFAGLADEYYTSDVSFLADQKRTEPWEPNATALSDPAQLKWKDLVEPGTPLPTPWHKDEFERMEAEVQKQRRQLRAENKPESEMEELFRKEREQEVALFRTEKYARKVGAFEGANYEAKGYYRPEVDCIMFTRYDKFCAVCRRAIERVIGMYT
jgi:IgA Peptidase M64/Peptidase M64 N-terminus